MFNDLLDLYINIYRFIFISNSNCFLIFVSIFVVRLYIYYNYNKLFGYRYPDMHTGLGIDKSQFSFCIIEMIAKVVDGY